LYGISALDSVFKALMVTKKILILFDFIQMEMLLLLDLMMLRYKKIFLKNYVSSPSVFGPLTSPFTNINFSHLTKFYGYLKVILAM